MSGQLFNGGNEQDQKFLWINKAHVDHGKTTLQLIDSLSVPVRLWLAK